jgi:hypothetical protein
VYRSVEVAWAFTDSWTGFLNEMVLERRNMEPGTVLRPSFRSGSAKCLGDPPMAGPPNELTKNKEDNTKTKEYRYCCKWEIWDGCRQNSRPKRAQVYVIPNNRNGQANNPNPQEGET